MKCDIAAQLAEWVYDARQRTFDLVADLDDEQLIGPYLPIVNPPLWEIGHVAWFQENGCCGTLANGSRFAATPTPSGIRLRLLMIRAGRCRFRHATRRWRTCVKCGML